MTEAPKTNGHIDYSVVLAKNLHKVYLISYLESRIGISR